jgi:hypothetical protein
MTTPAHTPEQEAILALLDRIEAMEATIRRLERRIAEPKPKPRAQAA